MFELSIPYPPTINHYYGRRKTGGNFIKPKGVVFRRDVQLLAKRMKVTTMNGPLSLTLEIYPPDKRKRDIDNINKALFDALEHANVFVNDSQIIELHSYKREPVKGGKVIVKLEARKAA